MSNSPVIRICIAALRHGQHGEIGPADLKILVDNSQANYNIAISGRVYGDSPDEWSPFEDEESMLTYLHEAGFAIASVSSHLAEPADPKRRNALVTGVDLYVFDPLFLTLGGDFRQLVDQLQGAIRYGNKAFCIVIPDRLPTELKEKLLELCDHKLPLLKYAYENEGRGEWGVNNSLRLKAYLHRLHRQMITKPSPESLQAMVELLIARGIPKVDLTESPSMLSAQ
jgi:hypothetical protein